jgi:hypothetical protein
MNIRNLVILLPRSFVCPALCFKPSKNPEYYLKGNRFRNIFQEWVRYNTVLHHHPPSPSSISWYKCDQRTSEYMSIELQTPAADLHLQVEVKNNERLKNIEQEIECPRCSDIMTLTRTLTS